MLPTRERPLREGSHREAFWSCYVATCILCSAGPPDLTAVDGGCISEVQCSVLVLTGLGG